jgi:hypothetical protein
MIITHKGTGNTAVRVVTVAAEIDFGIDQGSSLAALQHGTDTPEEE